MHRRLLGLLAIGSLAFAACSPSASAPPQGTDNTGVASQAPSGPPATRGPVDLTNSKYAPETGKQGGQLVFGDWQEANQFNYYYTTQVTEANVASATWAALVATTNDFKYLPDLATDVPTTGNGGVQVPGANGDAMTVTYTLKDGVKWSDGQPITCDDFEFTRAWNMDPANTGLSAGTAGWEDMTKIECPSPNKIVMHFKNIYEGYIGLSTPLPQHYLKDIPIKDQVKGKGFQPADMPNVPTSGAFKFESVTSGQELRLVRNDNYKGFKSGHPAYLDKLIFKWYGSSDAMIQGFVTGEVDIATDLVETDIPTLKAQGFDAQVKDIPSLTYEYLALNWATGKNVDPSNGVGGCSRAASVQDRGKGCPVSDAEFRKALNFSIDKQEVATRILGGLVQVANTNTAPDAYYYSPQQAATFDQNQAKSILDAAGWKAGADGIRVKDGLRAKIELCSTTKPTRVESLKLFVEELKAVGIEAIANNVDPKDIFADFNSATPETPCSIYRGNFDAAEFASSVPIDPISNYTSYHSSQIEPKGGNIAGINDPDIDKALETVKNTVDLNQVVDAMATFQKIYVDKTVEIPLFFRGQIDAVSDKVGNFFSNPTSAGPTWNAVDWYLKG